MKVRDESVSDLQAIMLRLLLEEVLHSNLRSPPRQQVGVVNERRRRRRQCSALDRRLLTFDPQVEAARVRIAHVDVVHVRSRE